MTTTIQVRTNMKAKRAAQNILASQGLNLSTAFNIFLYKIIEKSGIPFPVVTKNGLTPAEEDEILREVAAVRKRKKSYATIEEAHKAILRKRQ